MSHPKVSICVPNLNTRPFLQERFDTIISQTIADWELIVVDNYSDDGAWEFFQDLAKSEPRMQIAQAPKEGLYANWNNCIRKAAGEYVYIATSDDTMPPDCLEKMVAALEANPDCDVAHCPLHAVDEHGNESPKNRWWREESTFARSSGDLLNRAHVRRAPYDGLLHLTGGTVYISITQILIRRSLFEKIGLFDPQWGSIGDFSWDMRAGLVANTVHVPGTWGGWRQHGTQATEAVAFSSPGHAGKIDSMIEGALAHCEPFMEDAVCEQLRRVWEPRARDYRHFRTAMMERKSWLGRQAFALAKVLGGSAAARDYFATKLTGKTGWAESAPRLIRSGLEETGSAPVLAPAPAEEELHPHQPQAPSRHATRPGKGNS